MANELREDGDFDSFVAEVEPRLRRALVSAYGFERGREATAEALAWAWEHWGRVREMQNAAGYLYRVGRSRSRRISRRSPIVFSPAPGHDPEFEPGLPGALAALTEHQRTAVVLVHAYGWTLREVGELTGVRVTTVQNHLERGLAKLRRSLGVGEHA